jgi:hypothetical protein
MISLIPVRIIMPTLGNACGRVGKPVTNSCGIHEVARSTEYGIFNRGLRLLRKLSLSICSGDKLDKPQQYSINEDIALISIRHRQMSEDGFVSKDDN